jgi:hypothetical protein
MDLVDFWCSGGQSGKNEETPAVARVSDCTRCRNRTDKDVNPQVFETSASTSSANRAYYF